MSAGTADELSGVEVQDDTHFTIQLKKPYAPVLFRSVYRILLPIYPPGGM